MRSVTLRQIEYATATARFGGVTAAATALNVSQPALSIALTQLEAALGQKLFHRRPGGPISLTSFGRHWIDAAQAQLDAFAHLMSGAATPALPIRLAVFEDLAPQVLAPLLRRLRDEAPQLRIHHSVLGFEALTEALKSGQAELALTWDLGLESGVQRDVLARMGPHAILAPDHPLARPGAKVNLAALASEPLVLTDQGPSLGHMRGLFAQAGLVPTIAHRTATVELMRSFAANGLGVGLSYTPALTQHSQDGAPLILRPVIDAGTESVVLARSGPNSLSLPAQTLANLVAQILQGAQAAAATA